MAERDANPRREAYRRAAEPWGDVLGELRRIVLACGLVEEEKWGAPCFTADGGNVVILAPMKDSCALSFFKGVLLKDPEGGLEKAGANTRSGRIIRFTAVDQVLAMEGTLRAYVTEAAELERAGATVDFAKDRDDIPVPDELRDALDADPALRAAWEGLTPGRRRGWLVHVTGAKASATRASRVAKAAPRIMAGKGLHDR